MGALRSFVFVFFNFDILKSVIEFNNSLRSSVAIDCVDETAGVLGTSTVIFGDGIGSIVIDC